MTLFQSVRSRLTIALTLATGVVVFCGTIVGLNIAEDSLINEAIDSQNQFLIGDREVVNVPSDVVFEEFVYSSGSSTEYDLDQEYQLLVVDIYRQIHAAGLTVVLADAIDLEPGEPLFLWTPETVAEVNTSTGRLTFRHPNKLGPTDKALNIDSLAQLIAVDITEEGPTFAYPTDPQLAAKAKTLNGVEQYLLADVTGTNLAIERVRRLLYFGSLVIMLLAGLAAWTLTGRALRPVRRITSQVSAISAGHLDNRVPEPKTNDEIGQLARTMNQMLARIAVVDSQRRQFVSDAAHELRTPVAVLKSEAEVALKTPKSTDVPQLAQSMLTESDRMADLVEDLLTLARSDEGTYQPSSTIVDLDEMALAEASRSRRLPIDASAVSAGRVKGRSDELQRLIRHLLDNACRHGRSQVSMGLQTDKKRNVVRFWVDDDGEGIPEQHRSSVFDRFVRLQEARDRDSGGAGLGLAVVSATITNMGGQIVATKSPELGGARFLATFPQRSVFGAVEEPRHID